MPVPSTLASLSTTPGSNSPTGGENPFPELDDHIRQGYAFTAQLRDQKLNSSAVSAYMLTVLDDADAGAARTTLGAVGNTGNETIAGVKTFSSAPVSSAAASADTELTRLVEVRALLNQVVPPGTISAQARLIAPTRWLLVDGRTIGNASSGATSRANADTWLAYEQLWAFAPASVPIFDSTGAPSTRGASALTDFNAGKRIGLFTPDGGAFLRMWAPGQTVDPGRVAGSVQNAYAGSNTFVASQDDGDSQSGSFRSISGLSVNGVSIAPWAVGNGSATVDAVPGDTRPYNLAIPHYIFLGL